MTTKYDLVPSHAWPLRTRWTSYRKICRGAPECLYEPKLTSKEWHSYSGCNDAWRKHYIALFDAFHAANPKVMFRARRLECIGQIRPAHRCIRGGGRGHRPLNQRPMHHAELCRLHTGDSFIISQPYCSDDLCEQCLQEFARWQVEIPDITWHAAGTQRSWYFPNRSNLLFMARQKVLDELALDYPVDASSFTLICPILLTIK